MIQINSSSDKFVLTTVGAVALAAPPSAPAANLNNSQISLWLDEHRSQLKVSVRYSDGTLKTATIPLA